MLFLVRSIGERWISGTISGDQEGEGGSKRHVVGRGKGDPALVGGEEAGGGRKREARPAVGVVGDGAVLESGGTEITRRW